jgi:SAM-dependent methyltransferase
MEKNYYNRYANDKNLFYKKFIASDIYKQLIQDYQHVHESIEEYSDEFYVAPRRTYAASKSIFYYRTFYYIQMLLEKNPKIILDLGCGSNLFKKYIPQIYGIDPDPKVSNLVDSVESYSNEWLNDNLGKYDCAMTIGAIHGVSLVELPNRINDFGKVIKSGGRGYFGVNLRRPMQNTEIHEYAELFNLSKRQTLHDLYRVVRKQCEKIKYNIIALDINFLDYEKDRYENLAGSDWPSWQDYLNDNVKNIDQKILDEIAGFKIGCDPFTANGPSEVVDGNLNLIFEV